MDGVDLKTVRRLQDLKTDEIAKLSGHELDHYCVMAIGWTLAPLNADGSPWTAEGDVLVYWLPKAPGGEALWLYNPWVFHDNPAAAFELLIGLDVEAFGWSIEYGSAGKIEVYSELAGPPVASGPIDEAATVLCRAFLLLSSLIGLGDELYKQAEEV